MSAASDRLKQYNTNPYNSATNPRGFAGVGGMDTNWIPALQDVASVGEEVAAAAELAVPAAATATNAIPIVTAARDQAVAAANTAAGIVQHVQPSEIAGIDPALDFVFSGTSALPSGVVTGSSGKFLIDRTGLLAGSPVGTPPIDFDPMTGAVRGLRVEGARTNIIIGSDAPSTQAVSVTAQAYTLSFYGTGTVALSGAYSGSAVGVGAFPSQKTLTFTPTAGTLTLTISGAVQNAQLEAGTVATTYVRTVAASVTRTADVNTVALSGVAGWSTSEGTIYVTGIVPAAPPSGETEVLWQIDGGTSSNRLLVQRLSTGAVSAYCIVSGATVVNLALGTLADGVAFKVAFAWKASSFAASLNGAAVVTAASGAIPTGLTTLRIGHDASGNHLNSTLSRITYFPRRLAAATLPLLTA